MFGLMGVARMSGQPGGAFSPLSLFASGEQGVWYDPSDFSSMFQDSGGTTPVTAVGQPVGRINDKSGNGNHATQATAAARPVVSARKNWAQYTNDITNAVWTAFGGSTTKTATGVTFDGSANDNLWQLAEPRGGTSGITSTVSMTVSCASGTVGFRIKNTHSAVIDYFGPELVATTTPTRVSFTQVFGASAGNGLISAGVWNSATSPNSGTLIITDVQVEIGPAVTTYQRVTTASDYDTAGFPHYLAYDGIDDELSTTFPDLGTAVTIARAVPMVGAAILTGQTIGAGTWTDSTNHAGLVIIDRALTAGETTALTAYLNEKAGV